MLAIPVAILPIDRVSRDFFWFRGDSVHIRVSKTFRQVRSTLNVCPSIFKKMRSCPGRHNVKLANVLKEHVLIATVDASGIMEVNVVGGG